MTTTQQQLDAAADLQTLCDLLNAAPNSAADLDTDSLPTFGGADVLDTPGVYSWDADGLLIAVARGTAAQDEFVIVPRNK